MSITSYQIAPSLHLVKQEISYVQPKAVHISVNHIVVLDCSGSMSMDLPKIASQLKAKLPKLINEGDTLTLIWFSGRGEFGVVIEGEEIATLKDLSAVNKLIDRWLRPVGMTGFKQPIEEVSKVIARIGKTNSNPFSLFFMSDGCDNQWSRAEILKALTAISNGQLVSSTFVEYGYYADRALLADMAAKMGGAHIHADAFAKYEPVFDVAMKRKIDTIDRVRLSVNESQPVIGDFAFTLSDCEIIAYETHDGTVTVPMSVSAVYYFVASAPRNASASHMGGTGRLLSSSSGNAEEYSAAYAAMSLFAVRMKSDIVYSILRKLGDVAFIDQFSLCFGKQKYSKFMDDAKAATFDASKRMTKGYDANKVPNDDAFTIFDLLKVLEEQNARILLDHPDFIYGKISRSRLNADDHLSAAEQEKLMSVQVRMQSERSAAKLKEYQAEIDSILASKGEALKFVADPSPDGYAISSLTYNESRPNISMLVKKTGYVDLSARASQFPGHGISDTHKFKTFIFRNYAIVADGLVHIEKLPVKISHPVHVVLTLAGVKMTPDEDGNYVIDLAALPIINRRMVQNVSAASAIVNAYDLLKAQATAKVVKDYRSVLFPTAKLQGWKDRYGEETTLWLQKQGLTEYSGFNPKMVQAESTDVIVGKELDIKLKGYSTLPTVSKVRDALKSGAKMNGPTAMMAEVVTATEAWLATNPKKLHEAWLTGREKALVAETRALMYQNSRMVFSIIVGQTWFTEFATLDDNTFKTVIGNMTIEGVCELREVEIKI